MSDVEHRFGVIGRFATAYGNAIAAAFEKVAAEMSEAAKKLPEREYWRGYEGGRTDAEEAQHADPDETTPV